MVNEKQTRRLREIEVRLCRALRDLVELGRDVSGVYDVSLYHEGSAVNVVLPERLARGGDETRLSVSERQEQIVVTVSTAGVGAPFDAGAW